MRRALFGSLLIAIAAAAGLGVVWFFSGGTPHHEDAETAWAQLSDRGANATYYARYEAEDQTDSSALDRITFYNEPGVGFRFELSAPLAPDFDAKQRSDLLRSGDIFIVNPALPESYISCRTLRQSCRTADGLERLAILSFAGLFSYDQPRFEQPHTVMRTDDISAAGERGMCFVIAQRIGAANERPTAERGGFVPGAGLPQTFCYASDGVPLGGLVSDTSPNTDWLKAVEVQREFDRSVFEPPFPIVPSVYDRTPTPEPSTLRAR